MNHFPTSVILSQLLWNYKVSKQLPSPCWHSNNGKENSNLILNKCDSSKSKQFEAPLSFHLCSPLIYDSRRTRGKHWLPPAILWIQQSSLMAALSTTTKALMAGISSHDFRGSRTRSWKSAAVLLKQWVLLRQRYSYLQQRCHRKKKKKGFETNEVPPKVLIR